MNTTINSNCFQNADVCRSILRQSTPIAIRALSVTSKTLNQATAQFKIDLVLENKEMTFTGCQIRRKVFNEKIITQITDKNRSLEEKISALKTYLDIPRFAGDNILYEAASSFNNDYSTLEFLLKLCPNLDTIVDTYMPTPLFSAASVHFKEKALKILIDAGADWRITNPDNLTAFERNAKTPTSLKEKNQYEELIAYAKAYWKQLNRENTPIPSRTFTIQNPRSSEFDIFNIY